MARRSIDDCTPEEWNESARRIGWPVQTQPQPNTMSDIADRASADEEMLLAAQIQTARAPKPMPAGEPGECDLCGEWSGRLVAGACCPCRDRFKLP